jgi:dolichol-phosphate mannosyltransferase
MSFQRGDASIPQILREGRSERPKDALISIVVPVLNEEGCIEELARRVSKAVAEAGVRYELIFVDDGSRDRTPEVIMKLQDSDPSIRSAHFTRCFGHQAAIVAGLRLASGDAVITMDGDLQHPPESIPHLVAAWRNGADVVHSVRRDAAGAQPLLKRFFSDLFYSAMDRLAGIPVVQGGADFRLLDRRAVEAFNALEEHFVFVRGLVPWLGFPADQVEYEVGSRHGGSSKYNVRRMIRLALDGLLSFSVVPLRLIALLGLTATLSGVAYGIFALVAHATGNVRASGWTSLVVLVLVFGGIQLTALGIVSEYIGRIYEEVKRRPRYVIDRLKGFGWH